MIPQEAQEEKAFQTTLKGTVMTFFYRGIRFKAEDFRVGERVYVELDGADYTGFVTSIASYGVDVRLEERA